MLKLLVADDSPLARQAIRFLLHNARIGAAVVAEAGSGQEAVRLALEKDPDIIFMDIKMPGGDGLAALQELRRQGMRAPCIIITAFDDLAFAQEAIRLGVTDFLLKPIVPEELSRALERAVSDLRLQRNLPGDNTSPPRDTAGYPGQIERELLDAVRLLEAARAMPLLAAWHHAVDARFPLEEGRVLAQQLIALAARAIAESAGIDLQPLTLKFGREIGEEKSFRSIRAVLEQAFAAMLGLAAGQKEPRHHQIVAEAVSYLKKNYDRPIRLKDVAAAIHVSPYYLSHLFSRVNGEPLVEHLKQIRLEEAKRLLLTTDLPIMDVAARVGFRNIDHFSKIFKLEVGVPPSGFRNGRRDRNPSTTRS